MQWIIKWTLLNWTMRNLYRIIVVVWMVVTTGLIGTYVYAENISLPDSLITEDYVYEYTFSNFDKAERIMHELRKRKSLPDFRLDATEGDLYFNTGHYYQALKFYKRVLENDSVRLDDNRMMEQLHRLISCYDCLHNEVKKAEYVDRLLQKAEQCGNKGMQSIALFNMGKMLYYQGNKSKGYDYMQRAITLMEESDYTYKYDNLRYNYNTLVVFQEKDRRNEDALQTLKALEKIVTKETGGETPMEGLDEKEKKAIYAYYAIALFRVGQPDKAEEYYQKFLSTGKEYDKDDYLIMPYLFDRKTYDEVIRMNSARERKLSSQGDTVSYHMTTIKRSLGWAYLDKGDYKTASHYFLELAVLCDSIKNREQKSSALELATFYETHEKDLFIQKQAADIYLRNVLLVLGFCIVVLSGILLWRTKRYNCVIKAKNSAMAGRIDNLLGYKDELFLRKEENLRLVERLQAVESELQRRDMASRLSATEYEYPVNNDVCASSEPSMEEVNNEVVDADRALFDKVEHEIITRKLFLQPDFSREELIKIIRIPKNKFSSLFKQYTGVGFPQYINNLRLDYATRMLKEHPDYSVEVIARSCGISSSSTFYRLFFEQFGMTPTEYRTSNKKS